MNLVLILQILIDGRDGKAVDVEGQPLPTLLYLSREKGPKYQHNFKAGAMNALVCNYNTCIYESESLMIMRPLSFSLCN